MVIRASIGGGVPAHRTYGMVDEAYTFGRYGRRLPSSSKLEAFFAYREAGLLPSGQQICAISGCGDWRTKHCRKNKREGFVRFIAVVQILWFVMNCIDQVAQHLV